LQKGRLPWRLGLEGLVILAPLGPGLAHRDARGALRGRGVVLQLGDTPLDFHDFGPGGVDLVGRALEQAPRVQVVLEQVVDRHPLVVVLHLALGKMGAEALRGLGFGRPQGERERRGKKAPGKQNKRNATPRKMPHGSISFVKGPANHYCIRF
jgi:hypothetical protein